MIRLKKKKNWKNSTSKTLENNESGVSFKSNDDEMIKDLDVRERERERETDHAS